MSALSAVVDGEAALDFGRRAQMAASAAASHAAAVDRDARFPEEAFAVLRAQGLLSMLVPRDLGGDGASIGDVVDVCYCLGKACAIYQN